MKFWIDHPAADAEPVSFRRWLAWRIGQWMERVGKRLSWWAIDPDDEIPF